MNDDLQRRILITAGVAGALGVLLGSFSAHGLDSVLASRGMAGEHLAKRLGQFDVGVRYHLIHAVSLLALAGVSVGSLTSRRWVARLFLAGLIMFSGSLYALVLTDTPKFAMVTPFGGLAWIIGWAWLIFVAAKSQQPPDTTDE